MERDTIEAAYSRVEPWIRRTPVLTVDPFDLGLGGVVRDPVIVKLEHAQHSGSFKARGAHNQLLSLEDRAAGVVAASGGNYGVAVAYAARRLAVTATVFVPDSTAPAKLTLLQSLGATVEVVPGFYADALDASLAFAGSTGATFLHAFDQPEMLAGAGTIALELDEQAHADRWLVAVGGAGLIGGLASWWRGDVALTGVETHGCASLHTSLAAREPVDVEVSGLCADALGARRVGSLGFDAATRWVDGVVLVADDDVVEAQRRLWDSLRVASEPGGAISLAALSSGALTIDPGERIGLLVCGANVDPATLS